MILVSSYPVLTAVNWSFCKCPIYKIWTCQNTPETPLPPTWTHTQQPWRFASPFAYFNTQREHIISPRNKQTWRSSLIYDTTWSPIPVTIHCFYCHIFKFLSVTNFYFYFHFSFSPLKKVCLQTEILGKMFKYIFFCFIFLFTSSSPCREDQFAVLYFLPFDSLPYPTLTICRRVRSVNHVTTKRKEIDHILWVWGSVEARVGAPLLTLLEMWRRTGKTGYWSIWKEW